MQLGGDFGAGGEALIQQKRGGENARILVEVGGQLQIERRRLAMGMGIDTAGVPRAVQARSFSLPRFED